jgi:hypothetical protein
MQRRARRGRPVSDHTAHGTGRRRRDRHLIRPTRLVGRDGACLGSNTYETERWSQRHAFIDRLSATILERNSNSRAKRKRLPPPAIAWTGAGANVDLRSELEAARRHRRARRQVNRYAGATPKANASHSPGLTAPRADGVWLTMSFWRPTRPDGGVGRQKDMEAICRADETQSSRRDRSEAEKRRSRLTAPRRRGPSSPSRRANRTAAPRRGRNMGVPSIQVMQTTGS